MQSPFEGEGTGVRILSCFFRGPDATAMDDSEEQSLHLPDISGQPFEIGAVVVRCCPSPRAIAWRWTGGSDPAEAYYIYTVQTDEVR